MKRKIIVLLPILLFIPIFLWAAGGQDIAATTKLKGVIKDGVQIVAGLIALIAVIKIGVEYGHKKYYVRSRVIPERNERCYNKAGISHYRPFSNVVCLFDCRFHHAKTLKCPRDHDTDADYAFIPPYLNFRWGYFSLCLQYWSQAFLVQRPPRCGGSSSLSTYYS